VSQAPSQINAEELFAQDRAHLIHPQHHPVDTARPLMIVRAEGVYLYDASGNQFIDGLSSLWNVNIGHARKELAEAAYRQMQQLDFASAYAGQTNVPAIQLADKIVSLAPDNMDAVYFTSTGAEANESAFKTVRFYWRAKGQPGKIKIIARLLGYHGVTTGAMSATGIPMYWKMFEPRSPGFTHIEMCYPYRGRKSGREFADLLEQKILEEGPETVAAFIAEPIPGVGGVLVPPDDYFPRIREICDKYGVLWIADEVITGFCRTGKWFGVQNWGANPDVMSFAKGVTSAHLPLGGIIVSKDIHQTIESVPAENRYMHAATYSGHPVCCAVGVENVRIMEQEGFAEKARTMGQHLLRRLRELEALPGVGEVRGLGLMAAVEMVKDKGTREELPAPETDKIIRHARENGVLFRNRANIIMMAPPLCITEAQIDTLVNVLGEAIRSVVVEHEPQPAGPRSMAG
jgi:putrescine aminotransferase